jgi:hypothetical protein
VIFQVFKAFIMRISIPCLALLIPSAAAIATIDDAKRCNANIPPIDLLVLKGDANSEAIEDEVRTDLEKLGFRVETRFLPDNEYHEARKSRMVVVFLVCHTRVQGLMNHCCVNNISLIGMTGEAGLSIR